MSKISVIVPTLDEQKLLPRMLQQFTPELMAEYGIELIVSDGGSADRTVAIARTYAHKVVENTEHFRQTIAVGRNLGAEYSAGDILVFMNADTLFHNPDVFFQRVLLEMSDPLIAGLTCSVEVYPHERISADALFHAFFNALFYLMNSIGMAMGRGECHIIRREAFKAVAGYSGRIAAGEDYDMFRRLSKIGRVRFLKDLVVYESPRRYRRYGYTSVTLSWFLNFLSVFFLSRSLLRHWKPVR
jgi:glycosyltransferase involved in cell wall biosynthesis